jgi:hypothetical protein
MKCYIQAIVTYIPTCSFLHVPANVESHNKEATEGSKGGSTPIQVRCTYKYIYTHSDVHIRINTHPFFRDWLIIQGTQRRLLLEYGVQTLFTEEVATLSLHGVPHGQVALQTFVPLQERMDECATVTRHLARNTVIGCPPLP